MIRGIDASMNCSPYISNLQALSVGFIARYYTNLERTRNPGKALTAREAHDLSVAGFSLVSVWELFAIGGYFTFAQGQADGTYAYRYGNEIIRQPENTAIYFAADFDATEVQFEQAILPYFQGVTQGIAALSGGQPIYSVGVYGSGAVCSSLKRAGLVRYTWLSQSAGWQGSRNYQDWDIRQGALVSHAPFEFDDDVAKDQFGGFRLSFDGSNEMFSVDREARRTDASADEIVKTRVSGKAKKGIGRRK